MTADVSARGRVIICILQAYLLSLYYHYTRFDRVHPLKVNLWR